MKNHETHMGAALELAQQALEAGEFPVGCVIADETGILATGFRSGSRHSNPDETAHAEIIALKELFLRTAPANPGTLTIYSTLEPCLMCMGAILIHNIETIVYACKDVMGGGTGCDLSVLPTLYSRKQPTIIPGVLRRESLGLLQSFFSDPRHHYLRNTELADYVLGQ